MNQTSISNKNDPFRFLKPRKRDLSKTPQRPQKDKEKINQSPKPIIQNLEMKGAHSLKEYNQNKYFSQKCTDYLRSIKYQQKQKNILEESIIHEVKNSFQNNYETFSKKALNKMIPQATFQPKILFEQQKNELQNEVQNAQLKECSSCGRKFIISSYQRHIKICDSVFNRKRKPFSSQKQRSQSKGKQKGIK